jgi:hypothetical protein
MVAMQRPWALDGHPCVGETRIMQVHYLSSAACGVRAELTVSAAARRRARLHSVARNQRYR